MTRARVGMRKMRSRMGLRMRSRMGGMKRRATTIYSRARKRKYTKKDNGIGMFGMIAVAAVALWFFFFKDKKEQA